MLAPTCDVCYMRSNYVTRAIWTRKRESGGLMTTQVIAEADRPSATAIIAPLIIVALAGLAARTPLAQANPLAGLLLFYWIVAETLMFSLIARSAKRPDWGGVLGVMCGASFTVWLGSPSVMRIALVETPAVAVPMAIVVLGHVILAAARARLVFNKPGVDRNERWVNAASEMFSPVLVRLAVAELRIIYMAFFRWGGAPDVPANARAFAYHKHLAPMCTALLVLSAIEMAVYHLLLGHWSRTATVMMFIISDVGFVYLVGLIKSFRFRPILLTQNGVLIRAGFLIDEFIPLESIDAVHGNFTGTEVKEPSTLNAALLAWPNIMLRLNKPVSRSSVFKKKRGPFEKIAIRLDDPKPFIRLLTWRLGQRP